MVYKNKKQKKSNPNIKGVSTLLLIGAGIATALTPKNADTQEFKNTQPIVEKIQQLNKPSDYFSIDSLKKVIENDSTNSEAYRELGLAYTAKMLKEGSDTTQNPTERRIKVRGSIENGIKYFSKAIELNPNDTTAYYGRAAMYMLSRKYKLAIIDINKTLKLSPTSTNLYYIRGVAYSNIKEYKKAIKDFKKHLEYYPNDVYGYNEMGYAYLQLEQYHKAIKYYTKSINIKPTFWGYAHRATAYAKIEKYVYAIHDYTDAINLFNGNDYYSLSLVYMARGACYLTLGDKLKAELDFRKASSFKINK